MLILEISIGWEGWSLLLRLSSNSSGILQKLHWTMLYKILHWFYFSPSTIESSQKTWYTWKRLWIFPLWRNESCCCVQWRIFGFLQQHKRHKARLCYGCCFVLHSPFQWCWGMLLMTPKVISNSSFKQVVIQSLMFQSQIIATHQYHLSSTFCRWFWTGKQPL